MATPLYKSLKNQGTTFYAFPSASEDISAAYQNSNYKMYFSKYVLLNLPKQVTADSLTGASATASKPIYFDFDATFKKSIAATPAASFSEHIIESLRNYVANQEVTIKESKLNNTQYYYDNNALETTTEKIFFKWAKKLNIIDFEPAIPDDEYFSNLADFQSGNVNDDQYFPEYLWKEREVVAWDTPYFDGSTGKLVITFNGTTNFVIGDVVNIYNVIGLSSEAISDLSGIETDNGITVKVRSVSGNLVTFDVDTVTNFSLNTAPVTGKAKLVYNKLVRYIGEVQGVSNVQQANRSYTEVHAHIPDHTGQTPDILFRTMTDVNYKPGQPFPIIPSQYQPEIIGAESFNSPIVNTPQNYPGSYFGQFDTVDFTYETAPGDSYRRSGAYYGINGNINSPIVNGKTIDGITMDFNTSHYVKMNILGRNLTNFDQFNALEINNLPPVAFEFNAILWYYTVEDNTGKSTTNLYGISFLDHPDNNVIPEETSLRFPTYKKFVTNGIQDGTSFAFSLNLNFNIINENPQDSYNPDAINSMFSMNLFNTSMSRLAATNDSFINLLAEQGNVRDEVTFLKSLIYTQTDLATLNTKIQNLENLLRLYSTNQILSSDTIDVTTVPGTPPYIKLDTINTTYERVYVYNATDMYSSQGIIPATLAVPRNRDFLVHFTNNDEVELDLPNNDKLTFIFDKDLYYKQSVDITIIGGDYSTQNKMLDIYMNTDIVNTTTQATTQVLLAGNINLPVYYNSYNQQPNSSYLWNDFKFDILIDDSKPILLDVGSILRIPLTAPQSLVTNSIKTGDVLHLNNLFVGTSSIYDFSGQYTVQSVPSVDSYIILDISSNSSLVNYGSTASLPLTLNQTLSNFPYFSFNKGKKIRITRISNSTVLKERYTINIEDIK
jgi:hypothetical protein